MSYTKNTTTGLAKVLDNNKYYAFGMNHLNQMLSSVFHPLSVPYNYKYNGKELQETGMYDYGWRHYMPDIGRWNGMDQLSEMYAPISPYAYVANNPISFTDPDGRKIDPIEGGWKFDGSDIHFIFNYLANNGDFGDLVSQLEDYGNNYGNDFGSGPVSDFWNSFNSGDVTGVNVQNGWMNYSTPYGSNGNGMLQGFTSWNFQINQEKFNGFMDEKEWADGLGKLSRMTFSFSKPFADAFARSTLYKTSPSPWATTTVSFQKKIPKWVPGVGGNKIVSPGINMNANTAGKIATGLKGVSYGAGAVSGAMAGYDMIQNGITTSNTLDLTMSALAISPSGVGQVIAAGYFIGNMASILTTGKDIGQHMDANGLNLGAAINSVIK